MAEAVRNGITAACPSRRRGLPARTEGRYDRNRGDDTSCRGQHGRPRAGAPWTRRQQARAGQRQARRAVDRHPPGHIVRPADIGLHDQLIDAETAAEAVFGQDHRAEDHVEQAAASAAQAASWPERRARPVTARASAVLKVIGLWLPKRKTAVARTNQDTITATPTAAHTRPPPW